GLTITKGDFMAVRTANAVWEGNLREGKGTMKLGSGAFEGAYSFSSRFEEGRGTNPEELIGAAHAGCFSMALAAGLERAGFRPNRVQTTAPVHLIKNNTGFTISKIELQTQSALARLDEQTFQRQTETAEKK